MHTIAVALPKGGMAKTTTTVHLAAALAKQGRRVLVIDLDPQGHATELLLGRGAAAEGGTLDVLVEGAPIEGVTIEVKAGLSVCGSTPTLSRAEIALVPEMGRETVLKRAIAKIPAARWDLCLVDCPPSLGLLTANALSASDTVLSPVVPAYLSLLAVRQLEDKMDVIRSCLNPALWTLGYLLCAVDGREQITAEARELLRAKMGEKLFPVEVRVDARLKSAPTEAQYRSRAIKDYELVAGEVLRRLDIHAGERRNVRAAV